MISQNFIDQKYSGNNYSISGLPDGEYECCSFVACNFSNANLGGIVFAECNFVDCNFSMAKLNKTAFKDCTFNNCKMLGLHFQDCNDFLFEVKFENCVLNLSSFYKLKMKKVPFVNCSLQEVDFSECDLTSAIFDSCDLAGAIFDHTILEKVDFRTAFHYSLDPEKNKLKKAKFSAAGIEGLLVKYDIEIS